MRIRDVWFALDAASVVEILGQQRWAPLPGAPPQMPGVVPWRGRAIATLDLGVLTGALPPLRASELHGRMVILKEGPCTLALAADAVREITEVPRDRLRPPHVTTERFSRGEVELHGTVMPVLDLAAIVQSVARVE
jgi:chemotaxis signal transduction protein